MKTSLIAMLFVGATSLPLFAACQTASPSQASDRPEVRDIYVSTQGTDQRVVSVPIDRTPVDAHAPFALRGWEGQPVDSTTAHYAHGATNGF